MGIAHVEHMNAILMKLLRMIFYALVGIEEVVGITEKNIDADKLKAGKVVVDGNKEAQRNASEEKESEGKEITLEEYDKVLEEKSKALLALKTDARKSKLTRIFSP